MRGRVWLSLGALAVSLLSIAGCEKKPVVTPVAPTPVVVAPPPPPPPPPPPAPAALDSLALNPSTVRSQGRPVATVTLTAPAPAGGAVVLLSTSNPEVAKVPSGMTVQAGETTGTFTVDAATVPLPASATIMATYEGVTKTAVLNVQPPPLEPRFSVMSPSKGADACAIIDAFGSVDCQLDASASDGFIAHYLWTLKVGSNELSISASGPVLTPGTTCALLSGGQVGSDGTVPMGVSLQLEDRGGNRSPVNQKAIALTPNGRCGY